MIVWPNNDFYQVETKTATIKTSKIKEKHFKKCFIIQQNNPGESCVVLYY